MNRKLPFRGDVSSQGDFVRGHAPNRSCAYTNVQADAHTEHQNGFDSRTPLRLNRQELLQIVRSECEQAKASKVSMTPDDLEDAKKHLIEALRECRADLKKHDDRELMKHREETLRLPRLHEALHGAGEDVSAAVSETYQEIQATSREFDLAMFRNVRDRLRQYLTVEIAVRSERFPSDFRRICDALPALVEGYLEGTRPEYGSSLSDVVQWLNDLGPFSPEADRLAQCVWKQLGGANVHLYVESDVISSTLNREILENFDVCETILGTRLRGKGTLHGFTSVETVGNDKHAELRLKLDSNMTTETIGHKNPVRVRTENTGTAHCEKPIFIGADGIFTTPARSRVQLESRIKGLHIRGGPVIRMIARDQVRRRKPASLAEAGKRAVRRVDTQFEKQANPEIEALNRRYRELLVEPMRETGRFPGIWDFRTSDRALWCTVLLAERHQPGAFDAPPEVPGESKVRVHVHQSLFANLAASELAGRTVDELVFLESVRAKFPKLTEELRRDEEQPPLTVIFAKKNPLSVLFVSDEVIVRVHIDFFEREEQIFPGLDITLRYRMKLESQKRQDRPDPEQSPRRMIVFEESSPPTAFPPGFDPDGPEKISGREQIIRNIVLKNIERTLKKRFEISPVEIGARPSHRMTLHPSFARSENGWFTLAWDRTPCEDAPECEISGRE